MGYRHYHHFGSIYASVESVALEQRLRKAGLKMVDQRFKGSFSLGPSFANLGVISGAILYTT